MADKRLEFNGLSGVDKVCLPAEKIEREIPSRRKGRDG